MSEDARAVVRRFVEQVQDQHRLELADELFDPKYIDHAAFGGRPAPAPGCYNLQTDNNNCGGCGAVCAASQNRVPPGGCI